MTPPSDKQVETVAKRLHEIYFRKFWDDAISKNRTPNREYSDDRDSWETFNPLHKEALRNTIKELIGQGVISIGG